MYCEQGTNNVAGSFWESQSYWGMWEPNSFPQLLPWVNILFLRIPMGLSITMFVNITIFYTSDSS